MNIVLYWLLIDNFTFFLLFFLRFFPLFQESMTMENDIFVSIFFILFMKILYICELIM